MTVNWNNITWIKHEFAERHHELKYGRKHMTVRKAVWEFKLNIQNNSNVVTIFWAYLRIQFRLEIRRINLAGLELIRNYRRFIMYHLQMDQVRYIKVIHFYR